MIFWINYGHPTDFTRRMHSIQRKTVTALHQKLIL